MAKLTIVTDETKMAAIKKAATNGVMRKSYDSYEAAKAAFDKGAALAKKEGLPVFEHAAEKFESMSAVVAVVGARQRKANGSMESGIKALVLFPIPTPDQFIESAHDWVAKIIEKESAHVAFRDLRNAESNDELLQVAEKMPASVEEYVASHRGGEGIDTETFDAIWSEARKLLREKSPELVDLLPNKGETLKALRSKPYADSQKDLAELEKHGIFNFVGKFLIMCAQGWTDSEGNSTPLDTTAIEEWLENRETLELPTRKPAPKDFSVLDNFSEDQLSSML